jgi:spore maturation protein CgeB
MRIAFFYHSLISDWNHGNAHFLRGVAEELQTRGHHVAIYEPRHGWSLQNLLAEHGKKPIAEFERAYPHLRSRFYDPETLDLDKALADIDLVIVHEWNDHALVRRIGAHRQRTGRYKLLFHDTHHRSLTDSHSIQAYHLDDYDGVLAFGRVVRDRYLRQRWTKRAWIWHEAADARIFRPLPETPRIGDLVWVGNWGDEERSAQLHEFLFEPVKRLGLDAQVHGVRYPQHAQAALAAAGIRYKGWAPNYRVPEVFASFKVTVHIPRQPYVKALPGIPTIRIFEALACGIPLVCSPWHDVEGLFNPGKDYLVVHDGDEMTEKLRFLLNEPAAAQELAEHGLRTLRAAHTCAHRTDELLGFCEELEIDTSPDKRLVAKLRRKTILEGA